MSVVKTVVGRPTTLIVFFALLVGLGFYASTRLAIDLYPEISPPVLMIFTNYAGSGPQEIEKTITRPMEGALSNVSNIDKLTSVSSEGTSMIMLQFVWGTDMNEAPNDVRDKLEFVRSLLPSEATTPQIFKFDPSLVPILFLTITGNRTPEELRLIGENVVQPRIEQVEGVALASVSGGRERAVMVEIPQNRLEAYNLTLSQVAQMLRAQNVQVSAGTITEGSRNFLVRTAGEYTDIEQIRNTVVAYRGVAPAPGRPAPDGSSVVLLRDIANVYDGFKKEETSVIINGRPGVYVVVQKQSGTNSVRTADNVIKRLERINDEVPAGVEVTVLQDTTTIIRNSLAEVSTNAISGAVLAVLILFIFLRSLKSTTIIGLSIPISIVVTLMLMYFAGLTLNVMTLAGLALGIGMLVDNSIVILENIYRYREKGAKLTTAAILGSREMMMAISASTFTTISVFAPLALFRSELGFVGELFSSLAFTVVISLATSLAVAIFLVPVLASRYLPIRSRIEEPLRGWIGRLDAAMERVYLGMENAYKRALAFVLRHRPLTILVVIAVFVGTLFLIPVAGFELLPRAEQDTVTLNVELPIGTRLDITRATLDQVENLVRREVKGYEKIVTNAGERSFFGFLGSAVTHKGSMTITLPTYGKRIDTSHDVEAKLRRHFNDFPSVKFSFQQGGGGMGSAKPIDVLVKTDDLERGREIATRIAELLKAQIPDAVEPTTDFSEGLPQIEIVIDRAKASALGLNIATIGQEIRANIDGTVATTFRESGTEYDVLAILAAEDRDELPDLDRVFVVNPAGDRIPVASFATLARSTGPTSIRRENQTRVIHVTAGTVPGAKINEIETKVRALIASQIPASDDVTIEYSGDYQQLLDYGTQLIYILLIAVALVFGIMAAQFESFLDPFIVLFTIPVSSIGILLIHIATDDRMSLFTAVGVVVLVGIVVNNGIVLVDYTNLLRKRGMGIFEACVEAGGNRLRPVLMTSLTTILGLLPLAFVQGEGASLVQPIGKTVLGGMAASALLTLFLVPVIYSIFNQLSEKRLARAAARRQKIRQRRLQEART